MQSLATTVLQNNNFTIKLTKKLVSVAQKCSSNIEFFTCDMCQLISDVREPLVEEPMSQNHQRERDFKVRLPTMFLKLWSKRGDRLKLTVAPKARALLHLQKEN